MGNAILADYQLLSEDSSPVLTLSIADDVRPLYGYLPQTRMVVMVAASLITLAGILLALLVLRSTTLRPLQALTDHLHMVRGDRKLFAQKVDVGGTREMQDLGNSFNQMTGELGKLYKTLEVMAFTDQLTELPNRNRFQERLQGFMQIHQTLQKPFALLIMDLDRFKNINETLGHNVGDQLLKAVGMRLEQALRGSDLVAYLDKGQAGKWGEDAVARLGGDEFSAILPGVNTVENAEIAAQKVMKAMQAPFSVVGHELLVSLSIGIVLYPLHGVDRHDLMSKADVAMYQAKKTRQGYVVYESSFDKNSLRRLMLERDLHNAILQGQLVLYYQPKIDLATGKACGSEALVRWKHPELGMVPPDEFISLAEQSGQIRELSAWVLYRAVKDCNNWRSLGYDVSVSINLSAINLRDRELFDEIGAVLDRWSFDPAYLILELTESAVMSDPAHAMLILKRLREMGLGLSIDDFGTGYSSLAYLKELPVTEIKVDRSFVRDMAKDSGDQAIIRAVVALAQNRHLSVVAEGVEDKVTYDLLRGLNCGMVQGYYVARPMPVQDFLNWLESSDWRPARAVNS
jgi:predicted signal transduction protein with EAL and GGDEF domain